MPFQSERARRNHKICARDLLELFTQMIRADVNRFRHFAERKLFAKCSSINFRAFQISPVRPDGHRALTWGIDL